MDYKKLYLKYKTKYINAKKLHNQKNTFKGGSNIEATIDSILQKNKLSNDIFKACLDNHLDSKPHTYNSITTQPGKNLLVIVYAHWCGHCTNLIKEEGNNLVSSVDSSNIKFIDGTQLSTEISNILKINGFPTILKIDNKSTSTNIVKKEYIGDRTVNSLINFLEQE